MTDKNGAFVLGGLDPVTRFYDLFVNGRDEDEGLLLAPYEQKISPSVDASSAVTLAFYLSPAPYSVTGRLAAAAGGPRWLRLSMKAADVSRGRWSFSEDQRDPHQESRGRHRGHHRPRRSLHDPSLATGTYKLTAASLSYGSLSRIVS